MQYSVVDFPFTGQLREDTEPKLLSDGFVQISNGRFTKTGKIEKRLGLTQGANVQMEYIERLVDDNGRLIGIGDDPNSSASMCAVANGTRWERMDRIAEATIRREGIARDMAENILECNVGYSNGWLFYVWKRNDTGGTYDIWLRIVNATTGAIASETAITTGNKSGVKCIAGSGSVMLVTWFDSTNLLKGYSYDTSTNPPTAIASNVSIVADIKLSIYDIVSNGAGGWWLAYVDTSDDVQVKLISSSALGTTTNFTIAGTTQFPAIAFGTNLTLCYWDSAAVELRYDIWTLAGSHSAGPFVLDVIAPVNQPAVVDAFSGSDRLFAWTVTGNLHKWRTGSIAGVLGTTHVNYRFQGASKVFKDVSPASNSRYFQWVRSNDGLVQNRDTLSLVELNDSNGSLLRPIAVAAFGFVGVSTSPNLAIVTAEGTHKFRVGLLVAILPGVSVTGFDEIKIAFDHPNRWPWVTFSLSTYVGGGHLQQIAGKWVDETGFLQVPKIAAADAAGAGIAAGDYQYCLVYEYVADNGQRTYSLPSGVVSVTVADHGGGEGRVALTLQPLTLTNRQRGTARSKPKVLLAIYRTEKGPGEIFYRLHTVDAHPDALENDPAAVAAVSYTDLTPDFGILSHERLYTTGGVLENDAVYGGCTSLTRHKNRLFACGGELKSTIWYSQEFVTGRPAEWNIALQIEIPGEDIVAVASLDDCLVAFTATKIFAIYGDGPNATGDPNSGFFSVAQLVTSDTGCSYVRSIVQTSRGIYFAFRGGLYLLDRGRQLHIGSTPIQETAWTYRVVTGSAYSPDNSEVKFSCTNQTGDSGATLIYNETLDRWSIAYYFANAPLKDIIWFNNQLHVAYNGDDWYDDETNPSYLDNGSGYQLSIKTGQLSFGAWQSAKRCRRVRVMYTLEGGNAGMRLLITSYETQDLTEIHSWTATELAAIPNASVRAHVKYQKGHRYQFTIEEAPGTPTTGQGLSFQGLSFEVGSQQKLQKAAASASK